MLDSNQRPCDVGADVAGGPGRPEPAIAKLGQRHSAEFNPLSSSAFISRKMPQEPTGLRMAVDRVQRRMAAILAADVVGYGRLMGKDEESTFALLKAYRERIDDLISEGIAAS